MPTLRGIKPPTNPLTCGSIQRRAKILIRGKMKPQNTMSGRQGHRPSLELSSLGLGMRGAGETLAAFDKLTKKPTKYLYKALDVIEDTSPVTPHTPPSSPPSSGRANVVEEVVTLSVMQCEATNRSLHAPQLEREPLTLLQAPRESLGPSCFWHTDDPESPASEYSDRSIDSTRNSSIFSTSPTRLPSLPRTKCAICKDPDMILLNGLELACGHFAHKVCLKAATKALTGVRPECVLCGQDCTTKEPKAFYNNDPVNGQGTAADMSEKLELLGEELIECENHAGGPDTAPLQLRMFVHPQSSSSHEVLVRVSTPSSAFEHWRYRPTQEDIETAQKLTSSALGITVMSGSRINASNAGRLRLVSMVRDSRTQAKVAAYLFEHAVVLTQMTVDGFEELVHSVDLMRDDVELKGSSETLQIFVGSAALIYKASRETIANWIAASRDLTLNFPIAHHGVLSGPFYIERCLLHLIICLPFEHLSAIPCVISQLGPQDKLGLVVTTSGGSCAWLHPHKTSWAGWEIIAREHYRSFDLFTPATRSILETANGLLGSPTTGIQKSVALVAGCPLVTTAIGRPVHVVGIGDYDLDFLSSTATRSGGQFYHTSNSEELGSILGGIAAAERTYTHHDVRVSLVASPGVEITEIVGVEKRALRNTPSGMEVNIGSLLAGQSRTVLVSVSGIPTDARSPVLSDCLVQARSAITDSQQWETQSLISDQAAEFRVFSERMARIAAAILSEGVELIETGQTDELTSMLTRTVAAMKRAVSGFRANYKLHSQPLVELTDSTLTGTLAAAQAEILARGLEELQQQLSSNSSTKFAAKAVLLQASLVLQNQRAVTRRTLLEQVFHERLETNRV